MHLCIHVCMQACMNVSNAYSRNVCTSASRYVGRMYASASVCPCVKCMHICMLACMQAYMNVRIYECMQAYIKVAMYWCMHVRLHVCMKVYACVCVWNPLSHTDSFYINFVQLTAVIEASQTNSKKKYLEYNMGEEKKTYINRNFHSKMQGGRGDLQSSAQRSSLQASHEARIDHPYVPAPTSLNSWFLFLFNALPCFPHRRSPRNTATASSTFIIYNST